ncbi:hypothetical protein O6H91_17G002200 [Diphasiastrum complanatum]|uniref:Uncharacterized protein n=1 Tax=Diphasiastrum complanatum TaxID=34168 RepID=A0ACC2B3Q4_DIPCM|nr:hypothetical protein O6H91_17G002200 [Diphasiastrum complanatum]
MASSTTNVDAFWRGRLIAALKTGLACFMTGILLQEGKRCIDWLAFPVFSFVITVTVVGESTLGRGLHDAMRVLVGTIQSTVMAIVVMKLLYPHKLSVAASVSCIAISSFLIMYPKATHTLSKRVALAQTAIIYMSAYLQQDQMNGLIFPLRLATTTMMGTTIGTISILLPIPPRLAYYEIKQHTKRAAHTVAETFKIMIDAFCCEDPARFTSLILQAKSLSKSGSSTLASLKDHQADIAWELNCFRSMSSIKLFAQGVGNLKLPLVGMEMAFQSGNISQSSDIVRNMLQDSLLQLSGWSTLALRLAGADQNSKSLNTQSQKQIILEEGRELMDSFDESLRIARQKISFFGQDENLDDLFEELLWRKSHLYSKAGNRKVYTNISGNFQSQIAAMFFLYSMKMFLLETMAIIDESKPKISQISNEQPPSSRYVDIVGKCGAGFAADKHHTYQHYLSSPEYAVFPCENCQENLSKAQYMKRSKHDKQRKNQIFYDTNCSRATYGWLPKALQFSPSIDQFTIAVKVSIAMAAGAFLGVTYDTDHSHWADITIAMGIGNYQKGSIRISNMRLQGTVCGSIYGYLFALITRQVPGLCLAAMIPWVILTSFLRKSKMYGYSGSVSAVVAAMILLGKRHEGSLEQFAMIRMTEAFLGLSCFVLTEILFWPRRAAVLLEKELAHSLLDLQNFSEQVFATKRKRLCQKCYKATVKDLKEKTGLLHRGISRQNALINEAKLEPEFWYGHFQGNVYSKMAEIQCRMVDLLQVLISCSLDLKIAGNSSEEAAIKNFIRRLNDPIKALEDDCIATFEFLHEVLELKQQKKAIKSNEPSVIGSRKEHNEDVDNQDRNGVTKVGVFIAKGMNVIKSIFFHPDKICTSFTDLQLGSFRKHLNLHSLMELFESHYEETVSGLIAPSARPMMSNLNSSVVLSFSALTFCVHGLLKETLELEKCVIELLQAEHPWVLLAL